MEVVRKTVSTKWAATVASIWIQATSGSLYTFSIYSQTLKSTQAYSQSTLDTISVSKDFGGNCGILSGVLFSAAVSSAGGRSWGCGGPWVVHLAGAAQSFAGYFLIWAAVDGLIPRPPVAVMCLFMFMAAHAQSFFNTADVVTAVRNFPGYSGTAVGIMKVLADETYPFPLFISILDICLAIWMNLTSDRTVVGLRLGSKEV